ncbi:MAG: hypothetical protein AB8A46_07540, partial [Prochlorococcus sp.]
QSFGGEDEDAPSKHFASLLEKRPGTPAGRHFPAAKYQQKPLKAQGNLEAYIEGGYKQLS